MGNRGHLGVAWMHTSQDFNVSLWSFNVEGGKVMMKKQTFEALMASLSLSLSSMARHGDDIKWE